MKLELENVSVRYGEFGAVKGASLTLNDGQWLMLAGPNGAGKSTLIGAISGTVPYSGKILLDGQNIKRLSPKVMARSVAVLAQKSSVSYDFSVEEIVQLGRYSRSSGLLERKDEGGQAAVDAALEQTGLTPLRKHSVASLSGGEMQRVFLAQVFAQEPRLMILDEPANHLDLVYQKKLFELVSEWLKKPGRAVLSVVHDLSLARAYATHAALMLKGEIIAQGTNAEVFTDENLKRAYGMDVQGWMHGLMQVWN